MNIDDLTSNFLPVYDTTLPFSKTNVLFTPFKVKDCKNIAILLKEENKKISLHAMVSLLKSNTKNCYIEDLCLADAEYLYLQIRSKSVGEEINLKIKEKPFKLNINEIKYRNSICSKDILLLNGMSIVLKTPKIKDILANDFDEDNFNIKKYVKCLVIKNEIFDLDKFVTDEIKKIIDNLPFSIVKEVEKFSKEQPELYFTSIDEEGEREVFGTLNFFTFLQTSSIWLIIIKQIFHL